MAVSVSLNNEIFDQVTYSQENDFEQLVLDNAATIFGDKAIYIDTKKKINTSSLGGVIPDGFLIDISDFEDPQFYLVEVELQSHDFFKHIFPQITKFFAFYRDSKQRQKLIETMFAFFQNNSVLTRKLKDLIGRKEIHKFFTDTLNSNQNILVIIDGPKPEFEEIIDTYTDTWGKMVKVQIISHFRRNSNDIIVAEPPFQNLVFEDALSLSPEKNTGKDSRYTEEFHLEKSNEAVKDIYAKLKSEFLSAKSTLRFNPVKFYIGVQGRSNIAAIRFRKRKLLLEFHLSEDEVDLESKLHKVRLYQSRGPMVEISDTRHWDEIQKLISKLVEKHKDAL